MKYKFRIKHSPKQLRELKIEAIKQNLLGARSLVLFSSKNISHQSLEELRNKLKSVDAYLHTVKNTLFKRAVEAQKFPVEIISDKIMFEPTTVIYINNEDFIPALKLLKNTFGSDENITIKIAFLDNHLYESTRVLEFANIPSKQELYAKLVGSLSASLYSLYYALSYDMRRLAMGLQALSIKSSDTGKEVS